MAVARSDFAIPTTREPQFVIDVRRLCPTNRNATVFDAFDQLAVGAVLEINGEAEPRSLRKEFAHSRTGHFTWDARNLGVAWTIRVERIDERDDLVTFLSHCAPFSNARRATIAEVVLKTSERQYGRGDTIFDEAETWPYLGFVRSGRVIYTLLSPDGKSHSLGERLTYDPLNDSGTFDGGGATTRAEALTDVTMALIPAAAVLHAVRIDSEVALGFLTAAAQAQRRSIATIADLAFAHVLERVAKFLMAYAAATTGMAPGLPGIEQVTQAQIAAAAGTVRDMAARTLFRLRDAGAVELGRGRVTSIDRARLEAAARGCVEPGLEVRDGSRVPPFSPRTPHR